MPEKEVCLKWVGDKCIEWRIEDGKLTATINKGTCPIPIMKDVKKTLSEVDGFVIKFKD